jgi:phosphatidylglycerophosphate synthase
MRFFSLPNVLSLSRVVLAFPTAVALVQGSAVVTVLLFTSAIVTDVIDGRIARRRHQTSSLGTLIDHGADATFVTVLCATGVWLKALPTALPALILIAFLQYALDARGSAGGEVRGSTLGRWNGIAYFVLAGALVGVHFFTADSALSKVLYALGWVLIFTTLVSIIERAIHTFDGRRAR